MVSSVRSSSDLSECNLFQIEEIFFIYNNQFLFEKIKMFSFFCCSFFFKLLPKHSDYINSDDCIEKITTKSIKIYPVFNFKKFEFNKK